MLQLNQLEGVVEIGRVGSQLISWWCRCRRDTAVPFGEASVVEVMEMFVKFCKSYESDTLYSDDGREDGAAAKKLNGGVH